MLFRFLLDNLPDNRTLAIAIGKGLIRDIPAHLSQTRPLVSEQTLKLLRHVQTEFLSHLNTLTNFPNSSNVSTICRERGRFVFYLKYLKWLLRASGDLNISIFDNLQIFYNKLKTFNHDISDLVNCAGILALFPNDLFSPIFQSVYNDIFELFSEKEYLISAFRKFETYFTFSGCETFHFIANHSSFSQIIAEFPNARQTKSIDLFLQTFSQFVDDSISFTALSDIFLSGFSNASFYARASYSKFFSSLVDRFPLSALTTVGTFVSNCISAFSTYSDSATYSLLYAFELTKIAFQAAVSIPIFFQDCVSLLKYVARHGDSRLEESVCQFLSIVCPEEMLDQLLAEAENCYLVEATEYWPRVILLAVQVRLIIGSQMTDEQKGHRLFETMSVISQRDAENMKVVFHGQMIRAIASVGGEWQKWYLLGVMQIDEWVGMFGFGGPGKRFFNAVIKDLGEEEAVELFGVIVEGKEFESAAEWDVIAEMFREFPRLRRQFRGKLGLEERPRNGDSEVMAALDVIFESGGE
jgi:hypothetical protein